MKWAENWHVWEEGRLVEDLVAKTEEERTLGKHYVDGSVTL